ncbi:hypothetical protein B0H19DRAFT_1066436 [Mycena capillaripes]|nr:hypothetical protein B0H19DRAFT_1066436 [Mycena capillaripes]
MTKGCCESMSVECGTGKKVRVELQGRRVRTDADFGGKSFTGVLIDRDVGSMTKIKNIVTKRVRGIPHPSPRPDQIVGGNAHSISTGKYSRSRTTQHEHAAIAIRARQPRPTRFTPQESEIRGKPASRPNAMCLFNLWRRRLCAAGPCSKRKRRERGTPTGTRPSVATWRASASLLSKARAQSTNEELAASRCHRHGRSPHRTYAPESAGKRTQIGICPQSRRPARTYAPRARGSEKAICSRCLCAYISRHEKRSSGRKEEEEQSRKREGGKEETRRKRRCTCVTSVHVIAPPRAFTPPQGSVRRTKSDFISDTQRPISPTTTVSRRRAASAGKKRVAIVLPLVSGRASLHELGRRRGKEAGNAGKGEEGAEETKEKWMMVGSVELCAEKKPQLQGWKWRVSAPTIAATWNGGARPECRQVAPDLKFQEARGGRGREENLGCGSTVWVAEVDIATANLARLGTWPFANYTAMYLAVGIVFSYRNIFVVRADEVDSTATMSCEALAERWRHLVIKLWLARDAARELLQLSPGPRVWATNEGRTAPVQSRILSGVRPMFKLTLNLRKSGTRPARSDAGKKSSISMFLTPTVLTIPIYQYAHNEREAKNKNSGKFNIDAK